VNLAQGFPDFPMPEPMKDAAARRFTATSIRYAVTWGHRTGCAIAEKYRRWYNMEVDPIAT
jgi:aminotransferase